jgi:Ca2+-transporting ATPase
MREPPRKRTQPLIDRRLLLRAFLWLGMIEASLCYFGFFYVYRSHGFMSLPYLSFLDQWFIPSVVVDASYVNLLAVTVFHAGVVMAQVGNAFACRTEKSAGAAWVG